MWFDVWLQLIRGVFVSYYDDDDDDTMALNGLDINATDPISISHTLSIHGSKACHDRRVYVRQLERESQTRVFTKRRLR